MDKFMAYFKDPAQREKMMQAAIDEWVDLHKDEPPLDYSKPSGNDAPAPDAGQAPVPEV